MPLLLTSTTLDIQRAVEVTSRLEMHGNDVTLVFRKPHPMHHQMVTIIIPGVTSTFGFMDG